MKTIKKKTYLTILLNLNNVIRFFFFFDFFACEMRKKLIIFDVNFTNNWNNTNDVLKYWKKLYFSTIIRFDVITRNYNNSLTNYFEIKKTFKLFRKKYYWFNFKNDVNAVSKMRQFVKKYCELCAICKRNKTFKHKLYEKLCLLSIFEYK